MKTDQDHNEQHCGGWDTSDLSEILSRIWDRLSAAPANATDPLRLPILAVASEKGATGRVVVLRNADISGPHLTAYTDARSRKVELIQHSPSVEWVFYDPKIQVQIRARGEATLLQDQQATLEAWESTPETNRLNYRSAWGPGTQIESADESLSGAQPLTDQNQQATESGRGNFAVIECKVERMDWLQLGEPFHRRAIFVWDGRQFSGNWVVP